MESIFEHIPSSLQIYIDQFDDAPDKTIEKLEQHVYKRNPGAAGYFLLAWFCHKNSEFERAVNFAWSAKIHAPGSPLLEKLPYYLSHPKTFDAWEPTLEKDQYKKDFSTQNPTHPITDLDSLINKLSAVEKKRIKLSEEDLKGEIDEDLSERSTQVDDIVTETLALIHEKQKNYPAAIDTYKQLRKANPDKREHFTEQIFRLQALEAEEKAED